MQQTLCQQKLLFYLIEFKLFFDLIAGVAPNNQSNLSPFGDKHRLVSKL